MAGHGTYRTRARIAAALTAGAITFAPAVAGAQQKQTDPTVDLCRPVLDPATDLQTRQATFTVPDTCPPGWLVRYSANLVNEPCGVAPDGLHVCTLPDDVTVPWHDGLNDQTVVSSGVHDATPGDHLMPLVDPCHAPGQLLQLDLGLIPPGAGPGDEVNVAHRYATCDTTTTSTTTTTPTTVTTSDVRTPPPVTGHADCTAGGLPWFGFRSDTGRGTLHVTFDSPNGPSVMDVAELQPGVWSIVPGVGVGSDRVLDVTGATVDDGSPVESTGAECWRPEGPVSSTSVPAGAVATPSTTEPATLGFAVDGTQVTLGTAARASVHGDALPTTGADTGLLAVVAAGLLAAGAALLAHGRRLARRGA